MMHLGEECPLCCEPFDATDKQFVPCGCGYQLCAWCYHRIEVSEKPCCPKCQQVYSGKIMKKESSDEEGSVDSTKLKDIRVIRRDLCYIVGLPLEVVADETKLKGFDYLGKYGKVVNVIINRNPNFKTHDKKRSCATYVTYSNNDEAKAAIMDLDETVYEGRRLRASFGTTKYCSSFLKGVRCQNRCCFYLHHKGREEDSFTLEQLNEVKIASRGLTCSALMGTELNEADWKQEIAKSLFGLSKEQTINYFTKDSTGVRRTPLDSVKAEVERQRPGLAPGVAASGLGVAAPGLGLAAPGLVAPGLVGPAYSVTLISPPPTNTGVGPTIVHPSLNPSGPMSVLYLDVEEEWFMDVQPTIVKGSLFPTAPSSQLQGWHLTSADQMAVASPKLRCPPGFESRALCRTAM